jgi:NitT/TauT family transport system substrate-binding protein
MRTRRGRHAGVTLAAAALCALGAASCSAASGGAVGQRPVKPASVVVGAVPATGDAGLYVAQQRGLFAARGLHVRIEQITTASVALPDLLRGSINVLGGQWTTFLAAAAHGVASLRALAPGSALGPHVHEILTLAGSGITSLAGLEGKTIGVNSLNAIDAALTDSLLASAGIQPSRVHLVAVPYPDMKTALASHQISAAEPTEPWVTQLREQLGAVVVADVDQGDLRNFPVSGYVSTSSWGGTATARAFSAALLEGQRLAASDPELARQAVEAEVNISPRIAAAMSLDHFPVTLSDSQLQQVADLMLRYGQLSERFDARSLVQ